VKVTASHALYAVFCRVEKELSIKGHSSLKNILEHFHLIPIPNAKSRPTHISLDRIVELRIKPIKLPYFYLLDLRETDFLRQRLSIAIQRGNALAIRGSLGLHKVNECEERDD